jgi:iron complex outermembrane receptor protein
MYIGKQYFDLANSIDQSSYHLLNVNAGIEWKKIRFTIWSKNLTDTRYIDYAYDFGAVHLANPGTWAVACSFNLN